MLRPPSSALRRLTPHNPPQCAPHYRSSLRSVAVPLRFYSAPPSLDHSQFVEAVRERRITPTPGDLRRRLQELGRKKRAEDGEMMLEAVRASGGRLFVEYMNEIIKTHVGLGNMTRAMQVFERLAEHRLEPDVATYTILISALIRHRMHAKADALFDEMQRKKVYADGVLYSKMLTAYAHIGDVEHCAQLLENVMKSHVVPSHEALCTALQLYVAFLYTS